MKKDKALDRRLTLAAWGSALVLVGVLSLLPGEQDSLAVFGIGIILLGLNLARVIKGIEIGFFSTILGLSMSVLGTWALMRRLLGYPVALEVQLFPIFMISFGIYLLVPWHRQPRTA
jgi:hypothetical protein